MAIDRAVDSTLLDSALKASADEIRAKTGDSGSVQFDLSGGTGFKAAIAAIITGGGSGISAVKCIDIDVTVDRSTPTAKRYWIEDMTLITKSNDPESSLFWAKRCTLLL